MTTKTQPIVIEKMLDDETYATILRFMNEWVPLLPWDSDVHEPDSSRKFGRRFGRNLKLFVDLHNQLTDFASDLFGEKVKPSYSFLSMYENNGTCPLHLDRPQCRYTIDYLIRQTQAEPWPICISNEMTDKERQKIDKSKNGFPETDEDIKNRISQENWHTVLLNPNDAVCYSGTHSWHYRPHRLLGTADLAFFHFVPVRFRGPLDPWAGL